MHLGAWFTRLLFVSGAPTPSSSLQTTPRAGHPPSQPVYPGFKDLEDTLKEFTGDDDAILGSKIRTFFELLKDRESWKQVYENGLH